MELTAQDKIVNLSKNDTVAFFLTEKFEKDKNSQIPPELSFVVEKVKLEFFRGKAGETIFLPFKDMPNIIITGLGKKDEITRETLRNNTGIIAGICKKKKLKSIKIVMPEFKQIETKKILSSVAEGLYLANYSFNKYKSKNDDNSSYIEKAIIFGSEKKKGNRILDEVKIVCENTLKCRDLVNELSYKSTPTAIAAEAKKLAKIKGLSCKIFGKDRIEKMKMGLLLAVSKGSKIPPQLVILKYSGNPSSKKSIAIVGKGITFDSGGVNLKPTGHIEDMRSDMAGAAACLYAIRAAAELKMKKNIYAVMPLCENMLSNESYRSGDVYRAYNGKYVEIGNTDAEGRLILADALAYTEDKLKPEIIIDIATLTGACLVTFGEIVAALMSTDDDLASSIFNAGEDSGDRVWRLPIYRDFNEDIKSDIADLNNISSTRNAGTIIGGIFLNNFIKNTPWAHLDIAGTSWFSKNRGYRPKKATGFGVRLFIELFKHIHN